MFEKEKADYHRKKSLDEPNWGVIHVYMETSQ
jgi:hypothetical protein